MRDLNSLEKKFKIKVERVIELCKDESIVMVPYFTLRSPWQQAKYWRQSRSTAEVKNAIEMLHEEGAHWLAVILDGVGPQRGRWCTNALPGLSWHQYGEAVDCYLLKNGKANWDSVSYKRYAEISEQEGLTAGFFWRSQDAVHVQARKDKVTFCYDWIDIDAIMQKKFKRRNL